MRSPAARSARCASRRASREAPSSTSNPGWCAIRGSRRSRSGSSANPRSETTRSRPASRPETPPNGSITSGGSADPAKGIAIAFTVKSRSPRSATISPPRRAVMSTVRSGRTTRQAPWASDSGKGAPPVTRASRRAAWAGSAATTTSTSVIGRPIQRSRTQPPTKWASSPSIRRRSSSSVADDMLHPPRPRRQRRDDLVVDRSGELGPLLRAHPLAAVLTDQRHAVADLDVALRPDDERELVHADGRGDPAAAAPHQHVGATGQEARHSVRVAGRNEPDPGRRGGDEPAAVAGAVPRPEELHVGDVALEPECRPQAVVRRVACKRREPVDGDPAADGVEPRIREPQCGRAVRNVARARRGTGGGGGETPHPAGGPAGAPPAQRPPLLRGGDAQPGRARGDRRPAHRGGAVAVAVGLDD